MNFRGLIIIIAAIILFSFSLSAFCANYYVDAAKGSDENTGKSKGAAWKTITHAIVATSKISSPSTIYVAAGRYNMDNGETFPLYVNGNSSFIGEDPETTIIDAAGSSNTAICCQVMDEFLIEGFTITGGTGVRTIHGKSYGGGIYCTSSSPTIRNCHITGNDADFGGGIYFTSTKSELSECLISGNTADSGGGIYCVAKAYPIITDCVLSENLAVRSGDNSGGFGSGILVESDSTPHIAGCEFKNNTADVGGGGICNLNQGNALITDCNFENNTALYGGGIMNYNNSSPIIGNCTFTSNIAKRSGEEGGIGGGIYNKQSCNPTINGCNFTDNKSDWQGGGIGNLDFSMPFIADTRFTKNSSLVGGVIYNNNSIISIDGCFFLENSAQFTTGETGRGGVIVGDNNSTVNISNSVMQNNIADKKGRACVLLRNTTAMIFNNLLVGNDVVTDAEEIFLTDGSSIQVRSSTILNSGENIHTFINSLGTSSSSLENSIIRGFGSVPIIGTAKVKFCNIESGLDGEGNIDVDPLFVTGSRGDYYLSRISAGQEADSPCINAGSDTALNLGYNKMTTNTDGIFDSGIIDMGYHYAPHVSFDIWHEPGTDAYKNGDNVTVKVDLHTAPAEITADIYFVILCPDGKIYSGLAWNQGVAPLVANFTLPASTDVNSIPLLNFTIPSAQPPVNTAGTYYFGIVTAKPGTMDFMSELKITSLKVQ